MLGKLANKLEVTADYLINVESNQIQNTDELVIVTFGDKLKQLRVNSNLTQKQLGKLLDLAESTIGMYERNEREPDYKTLLKIADYFDVSLDSLFGRTKYTNIDMLNKLRIIESELKLIKRNLV
ncbi:XRE family transcriptional regulator [Butyricicoccus sp. 1XD8-22]|nr:XRE family transcriptional regulator [Butyricicoccus sp. 1XD8-22]